MRQFSAPPSLPAARGLLSAPSSCLSRCLLPTTPEVGTHHKGFIEGLVTWWASYDLSISRVSGRLRQAPYISLPPKSFTARYRIRCAVAVRDSPAKALLTVTGCTPITRAMRLPAPLGVHILLSSLFTFTFIFTFFVLLYRD